MDMDATTLDVGGPRSRAKRNLLATSWVVAGLVMISVVASTLPFTRSGSFVDQVVVTNKSAYDVDIDVRGVRDDGWMAVGTATNRHTTTFAEVFDQGGDWVVRFSTPTDHVDTRLSRDQLEQSGWQIAVPAELVTSLRDAGAPPSPAVND
jgi:hypothetical protein